MAASRDSRWPLPRLDPAERPFVSIVVPMRNEIDFAARCIEALERQTYPKNRYEIIVVDGDSDDGTREWLEQRAREAPVPLRIVANPQRITPVALNLGVEAASGDVVTLVSGHSAVAADFVEQGVRVLGERDAACAGGRLETVGTGAVGRAIALAQMTRLGGGAGIYRVVERASMPVDTVPLGAYRREVFDVIGMFDEELVRDQDDEFNFRLTQAGGTIWYDSRIRARYFSRADLRRIWRQYHDYGLYKVRLIQKRRAVPSVRHLIPAATVLGLLASLGAGLATRSMLIPAIGTGSYAAGCVIVGIWASRREPALAPIVPVAIASLHLPYGTGFLRGLVRFRKLWAESSSERSPS